MKHRNLSALSGALFVVLTLVAFLALGGDTPDGDDPAAKVIGYYAAHDTREIIAAVVLSLAAIVLVFFSAVVRNRLAAVASTDSALPSFAFAAGVVCAVGFLTAATFHFALADYADDIQPAAAQALNALDSDFFLPFVAGLVALVLGMSLLAVRTAILPTWMGWVGIVLFVLAFTPAGFVGFGLGGLWVLVASILLYLRDNRAVLAAGGDAFAAKPI